MDHAQLTTSPPVGTGYHAVSPVAPDADFDARWALWVERGRVHEQRARRRFGVGAGMLAVAAAIAYAIFSS